MRHEKERNGKYNAHLEDSRKSARDRQRITFLQITAEWSGMSGSELIKCTVNRNEWHKLVANVIR